VNRVGKSENYVEGLATLIPSAVSIDLLLRLLRCSNDPDYWFLNIVAFEAG
jgi:hypothetical protein